MRSQWCSDNLHSRHLDLSQLELKVSSSAMTDSRSLDTIQLWMQAVITNPDGVAAGIASPAATSLVDVSSSDVERVILPSIEMTSLDRLQIYGRAYFGRLLECLKSQFPCVRHLIGDEAFEGLAFGYLIEHPSTSPSLAPLGSSFDDYLTATRPPRSEGTNPDLPDFADLIIDLARLERIYGEVFDGPGPERVRSLEAADLLDLSPTTFAGCRLVLHDCVRLLEFRFPVHEYASAIRQGLEPTAPVARPISLVVTRRDYIVRRFQLTPAQFHLLSSLKNHATVGDAIERLFGDPKFFATPLSIDLQSSFREWSAAPLFSGVIKGSNP